MGTIPTSLVGLFTLHDRFTSYLRSKFERIRYTTNNKVVESMIPPLEEIVLPIEGKVITLSPFKIDITKLGQKTAT